MTVQSTDRTAGPFIGNGVQTAFPFTFRVFTAADVLATAIDTVGNSSELVLSSDYIITLNVDQTDSPGGTLTMLAPLASGYSLYLTTALAATQLTDITNQGGFFPRVIENALDKLTILLQQQGVFGRTALRVPEASGVPALPAAAARASKILAFDSAGNPTMVVGTDGNSATALQLLLADSAVYNRGAGMVGFGYSLGYAAGTVGRWLKDLALAAGSTFIGWIQAGTGAVLRTVHARLRDTVHVTDFGAVADGNAATGAGTDNLAAFQKALAYAVTNGVSSVYAPGGVYVFGARLDVPTNVRLYGAGMYCTILIAKSAFTDGLGLVHCNGVGGPPTIVEHMAILGQTSTGAGTGSCGINAAANAVVLQHLWVGGFTNPFQFSGTDGRGFDLWADVPLASGYGFVISNGGNTLIDIVSFNSYTGIYIDSTGYWSTSEPDIGVTIDGADIIQSGYSGVTMVNALNTTLSNIRIHSPSASGKFTRDMITITDGANITLSNVQGTFGNAVSTTCVGIRQTGTTQNLKVQGSSIVGADFGYRFENIPFAQIQGNSARNCRTWGFRVLGDSAGLSMQDNQSQFNGTTSATDGGGYWLSNSSGSGKWLITGNSAGDFGSTSKYGFYIDANASTAAKINFGLNAVTNTATPYIFVGTPANVTQTANI